jgi:hypothetical protein
VARSLPGASRAQIPNLNAPIKQRRTASPRRKGLAPEWLESWLEPWLESWLEPWLESWLEPTLCAGVSGHFDVSPMTHRTRVCMLPCVNQLVQRVPSVPRFLCASARVPPLLFSLGACWLDVGGKQTLSRSWLWLFRHDRARAVPSAPSGARAGGTYGGHSYDGGSVPSGPDQGRLVHVLTELCALSPPHVLALRCDSK